MIRRDVGRDRRGLTGNRTAYLRRGFHPRRFFVMLQV